MPKEKILVTGCAGFIGMHLCESLLKEDNEVFGIDNLNSYYDPALKKSRLNRLKNYPNFKFSIFDIFDLEPTDQLFKDFNPDKVVNLAAQAGVRYSLKNPHIYVKTNISGFLNILECSRKYNTQGVIYASSSSVYGGNKKIPFNEKDFVDNPISIYAASKKSNELMAKTYSHLYDINTTGLRFFTVYGPWGRPDMAMYIFTQKILNNEPIPVFNHGKMERDFTYIDDIIEGIKSAINKNYKCEIFNLGNNKSEDLMYMISLIERTLNQKASFNFFGMQPGDVSNTYADIEKAKKLLNFEPKTSINKGIPEFISWYKKYNE